MQSSLYSNVLEMVFRLNINYWLFQAIVLLPSVIIDMALNCTEIYTAQ